MSVHLVTLAVAAKSFDPLVETARIVATLSPAARARSDAYFEGGYWLILWDLAAVLLVSWLLLVTKLSARMRDFAVRITRFKWAQTALYAVQYLVITTILALPWAAYEGYFREHQYGMSNLNLTGWLGEEAKGLVVNLVLETLALVAIYAVIRKAARTWWLWGSVVAMAFIILTLAIEPNYLEPVFNKFYPLPDSELKQQILSLARANGIPAAQVYEFDASKQTTKLSAHVSGLFGAARISLNDNLMNRGSPQEIKAVLGHEMGHYVLNHAYKMIVFLTPLIIGGFAFVFWAYEQLRARYAMPWGIGDAGDTAGLPLLVALLALYGFVLTPVQNSLIRGAENEADAFGLNAAREPDGFAQAALHLSEYRKMRPTALEEFIFFDHPSGWNRIHRAMVWKAENIGAVDVPRYEEVHR